MIQSIVSRVCGIDVHKAVAVCTILIEEDDIPLKKETRQYRTFRSDLRKLSQWLLEHRIELIVIESTGVYWKSVYETLEDAELDVVVVNAYHIKNVPGRKTDVGDSEWLAELARCGLLRRSFIPSRDLRDLRLLTRYRRKVVGTMVSEKNRLHKILEDGGIRLGNVVSSIDGKSSHQMIRALISGDVKPEDIVKLAKGKLKRKSEDLLLALDGRLSDRHRFILERIQAHIEWIEHELEEIDSQIVAAMKPYSNEWRLLQTIPGIDKMSAAILLAEIGPDMQQFGNRNRFSKWIGVCPGNNESAGKKKSGRISKGNNIVKTTLCEIANSAIKTKSQFKGYYQGLKIRRGHKRAIVAVAHKIMKIAFGMLKRKEPYRDPEIDYNQLVVSRNASRWIRALENYGYLQIV